MKLDKRIAATLIVILMLLPSTTLPVSAQTMHGPIVISSDEEFTADNGVTGGTGTAEDPYIIEGWEMDAGGGVGILITGTTKYFVIRNCTIYNGVDGIRLRNLQNGVVHNCTIKDLNRGIFVQNVTNLNVTESTIRDDEIGIYIAESSAVLIHNNTIRDDDVGLELHEAHNNTITGNTFINGGIMNAFSYDLTVEDNTVNGDHSCT